MNNKGYTLIELVTVIVILGVFFGLAASSLIPIFSKGFIFSNDREDLRFSARQIQTLLSRDIRNLKDYRSLLSADSNNLEFINVDNQQVSFALTNQILNKTIDGISYEVSDKVVSLRFSYLDNDLAELIAPILGPTLTTNVRVVAATIVLAQNNQQLTVDFKVRPRNLN